MASASTWYFSTLIVLVALFDTSNAYAVYIMNDPKGDEFGTYPTADAYAGNGLFDLTKVQVNASNFEAMTTITVEIDKMKTGELNAPIVSVYIDADGRMGSFRIETEGGMTGSMKSQSGSGIDPDPRMYYDGWALFSVDSILNSKGGTWTLEKVTGNTITVKVTGFFVKPTSVVSVAVGNRALNAGDTGGFGFRTVAAKSTVDTFGGGSDSPLSPNVIDYLDLRGSASPQVLLNSFSSVSGRAAVLPAVPVAQGVYDVTPKPTVGPRAGNAGFVASGVVNDNYGIRGDLASTATNDTFYYGDDIPAPRFEISYLSDFMVRVKLFSGAVSRYEVPRVASALQNLRVSKTAVSLLYTVTTTANPFSIKVVRNSDQVVMFETTGSMYLKDQYLELSTTLPANSHLYGLGERYRPLLLDTNSTTYTMFNFDLMQPQTNLYGTHPVIFNNLRSSTTSSSTYGLFLLNSNGMDVILNPTTATYKTIGGVLDFYITAGPTTKSAVQGYQALIGLPAMPPYWALGFHQCRWGYKDVAALEKVRAGYANAKLPLEAIWSDIDYMDNKKLFTLDPVNYPADKLRPFVDQLHNNSQHYVIIIDPGVRIETGYDAYTRGLRDNVFIKQADGVTPAIGKVWPGLTSFIDFYHANSTQYWTDFFQQFHDTIPYDGLWIDMNEIASFCDGHCALSVDDPRDMANQFSCPCNNNIAAGITRWDFPTSYWPGAGTESARIPGGQFNPGSNTISMSSLHAGAVREYDIHNLYGHLEAQATFSALKSIRKKRPFILTRSSFAGTGHYSGKWTGDNKSRWMDLKMSIPGMLAMNLFGIPYVGSDICGFFGNTNVELCTRWIQLGAFYPFSRNHNNINQTSQELYALGPQVQSAAANALNLRYELLPHYYTLFADVHMNGGMVMQPIWAVFDFVDPRVDSGYDFMLGDNILISPVTDPGVSELTVYVPAGRWYRFPEKDEEAYPVDSPSPTGTTMTVPVPMNKNIPIHVRGGSIIPLQNPGLTTAQSRQGDMKLLVAFPANFTATSSASAVTVATGQLILDDGEGIDTFSNSAYSQWSLSASYDPKTTDLSIGITQQTLGWTPPAALAWKRAILLGLLKISGDVEVDSDGQKSKATVTEDSKAGVTILEFSAPLNAKQISLAIPQPTPTKPSPVPSPTPSTSPGNHKKPKNDNVTVYIVVFCVLAVMGGAGVFGFWQWKKKRHLKSRELAFVQVNEAAAVDFDHLHDDDHSQPFAQH